MARRKRRTSKYGRAVTGGRVHTVWNHREKALRSLKKKFPKGSSMPYRIANAGKTKAARKRMARKAVATKRRKYGPSMRRKGRRRKKR